MATRMSFKGIPYRKVDRLSDVTVGDVVCLLYFGLWHDVLVTRIEQEGDVTTGAMWAVHYSWSSVFHSRCIKKELFKINGEKTIWVLESESIHTYSAEERIDRARARIGEKKWNGIDNTSTHFCHWAITKMDKYSDISFSQIPCSFFNGYRNVHHMDEIETGDVVCYKKEPIWDKGVVVDLKDKTNGRIFNMDVIVEKGLIATVCKLVTRSINLDKDNLILCLYNPALCFSMEERRNKALSMEYKSSGRWTQWGFVEECIKKNN